jgi:hypothetical protein
VVVFNDCLDGLDAASGIRLLFLMREPRKNLDKINIVLLQVDNLKLCLVDFLNVRKGFFLDDRVLFLIEGLTNDWQDDFPTAF